MIRTNIILGFVSSIEKLHCKLKQRDRNLLLWWVINSNRSSLHRLASLANSQSWLAHCVVPENIHTPPTEGFWFASPHPFGISVPRGTLMTPLPPGISTLREHGFCFNIYYYNIHFQHITLCYCSILFACLLSRLKCSMFFTKICLNRVF